MPEIVQGIGALAGLAAVAGLPVLVALHVSHARDVKRLRTWAQRAPQRSLPAVSMRQVAFALVGALVLGVTAGYVTGDDDGGARKASPTKPKRKRPAVVKPGDVTVAVLNGTTVDGLAATLRDQIAAAGFKRGTIDVYSDQQLVESVVQYAPGRQAAAKAVGRRLGISRSAPVTADSRALAGDATVIVIAGADKGP